MDMDVPHLLLDLSSLNKVSQPNVYQASFKVWRRKCLPNRFMSCLKMLGHAEAAAKL